jgi:hypothetical protein
MRQLQWKLRTLQQLLLHVELLRWQLLLVLLAAM